MRKPSCHIITLANIKGGVGKTTATVNIAYLLAHNFNKKVLVIDSDDQGNATKALGIRGLFDREYETLWYALNNKKGYQDVLVKSPYQNIWTVPATKELKGAQLSFSQSARGFKLFKKLLLGVEKDFDFVLIDTKPQINILLQSALAASNWFLIPSFPEPDSYDGFVDLIAECEEIYEAENPDLNCMGVLFSCIKKSPAHETYMKFITRHLKNANIPVFKGGIKASNAIGTGSLHCCPASALSNSGNLKEDYLNMVKQILKFLGSHTKTKIKRPKLSVIGISKDHIINESREIFEIKDQTAERINF
ncbi:MAG: AAA family ATPase [Oligoflexales bacterium]|nr:AAA family ATPase [Oligoflexales bacterium]